MVSRCEDRHLSEVEEGNLASTLGDSPTMSESASFDAPPRVEPVKLPRIRSAIDDSERRWGVLIDGELIVDFYGFGRRWLTPASATHAGQRILTERNERSEP